MKNFSIAASLTAVALVAGCATRPGSTTAPQMDNTKVTTAQAEAVFRASYKNVPPEDAKRIEQDSVQKLCSAVRNDIKKIPPDELTKLVADQRAAIKYPASGQFMGDWKEGEKLAQSGYGLRMRDNPKQAVGGNCYACHQGSQKEVAYGTLGPSLHDYGKKRGNSAPIQKYVYEKIYNSHVYFPCSNMPRFGHNGMLTPEQITHLVAWLLDPESAVNRN